MFCLDGFDITLNPDDFGLSRQLWCRGYREPKCVEKYKEILKDDMIVFDIGSNIGHYPLIALNTVKLKKLFCFEPNSVTFNFLIHNLVDYDNVCLFNSAVVPDDSKTVFMDGKKGWYNNLFISTNGNGTPVSAINLNSIPIQPDIIRMDLEGYEYKLIPTWKEKLNGCKYIAMELHPMVIEEKYGDKSYDILDFMMKQGLEPFYIVRSYGPFLERGIDCDKDSFYEKLNGIGVHEYYRGGLGLFLRNNKNMDDSNE